MFALKLFTVYDTKAEVYFPPFAARHVAEAVRQFADLVANPQSALAKHPGDYRLLLCGEFHQDTGIVVALRDGVQLIEEGLALVREAM